MKWQQYYDEPMIRQTINCLKPDNELFEVRIIGKGNRKRIISGYFTDVDMLIKQFDTIDPRSTNMYITVNKINDSLYAREQHDCFRMTDEDTHDYEVDAYEWLFIDLDPKRISGISSTDEELEAAHVLSDKVYDYMKDLGFKEPVRGMSGNGYHLLYRICLPNTEDNKALVGRCLENLSAMFDTDTVKIDVINHNQSRVCKLYGTLAQKGSSTKNRPHRMSKITSIPEKIEVNDVELLRTLANELPEAPKATKKYAPASNDTSEFNLEDWMSEHGLEPLKSRAGTDSIIYPLAHCPFDYSHTNGDSKIFKYSNGAIAFKCHHNSCRGYKWQDVRLKYEPDAYSNTSEIDDERINNGYHQHLKLLEDKGIKSEETKSEKPKKFRKLKSAEALMKKNLPDPKVFIGVGEELPLLLEGTCILSAKPKLGKSWLALAMCIAVANGEDFIGYKTHQCSTLYLDLETSEVLQQRRLKKVLHGGAVPKNFYLENETDQIGKGFVEQIEYYLKEDPNIGIVVIDVFQIIRSTSKNNKETEYEHAYRDITPLNELAQKHHISIILVCHDRKAVDPDDPFSNILGSTGLQGAATQMMVMFRKKKDDPIHISIKGKTIDGLPELNVKLDQGDWSIVKGFNEKEREQIALEEEYLKSDIRQAVLAIAKHNSRWKGRCSTLIKDAIEQYGIGIIYGPKEVGVFLHRHQGRFLKTDNIKVTIHPNGQGAKIYEIENFTVDTVDKNRGTTVDEFREPSEQEASEIPFL